MVHLSLGGSAPRSFTRPGGASAFRVLRSTDTRSDIDTATYPGNVTYRAADPLDPPLVFVQDEDGVWCDGVVKAQEQRSGGIWWVNVVYSRDGNRVGWFPEDRVRVDETDYSRGRGVTVTDATDGSTDASDSFTEG